MLYCSSHGPRKRRRRTYAFYREFRNPMNQMTRNNVNLKPDMPLVQYK